MSQKKPLLELQSIGKIYVSEGNVAIGIRGVSLAFDRGEFVAITGESGSGKSTLLNVISGMDTYEEGELYIDGEPTSHFRQKDWEEYRREYISFIFQDYNILESFTVLQNVELALMHIDDPHARRERAMELIRRVGLEGHIKHKGSKLSGGQKQRTVIARALAKDSPIILADEPTGNLDSKSSREIIELLCEISRDKLVIVVTHNFDEVEHCATRHIRVFDGTVELDRTITPPVPVAVAETPAAPPPSGWTRRRKILRDGIHLGGVCFRSMPKLSAFLCCLMTLTAIVLTLMTANSYEATELFSEDLMFNHKDGRVILVRDDGGIMTDEEVEKLAADVGAADSLHYDFMLDRTVSVRFGDIRNYDYYDFAFDYPATDLKLDAGRYPEASDEVILEVPISFKKHLGSGAFEETAIPMLFDMATYRVVGVRYYYDNTKSPRMLFTEEGYRIASALAFFSEQKANFSYQFALSTPDAENLNQISSHVSTFVDFSMDKEQYYLNAYFLKEHMEALGSSEVTVTPTLVGNFYKTNSYSYGGLFGDVYYEEVSYDKAIYYSLADRTVAAELSEATVDSLQQYFRLSWDDADGIKGENFMLLSPDIFLDFMYEHYYTKNYTQASLFFDSDRTAHDKVATLRDLGYIAVVSDETVELDVFSQLSKNIGYIMDFIGWALSVLFATLFLSLCSSRAMNAVRGDIAIMRSMGIPTGTVRVSLYIRTLIALIPAILVTGITCAVIFILPATNDMFHFLHAGDYAILAVVLVIIALKLSHKQAAKMFNESVKKTLKKGGDKA